MNVSAKDLATSKEQSIRITASSGLSQGEIDRLVKEAEVHAEEDRKKKELVDARNAADALIYTTEKSMNELGYRVESSTSAEVEDAVNSLKRAMENEDTAEIRRLTEVLTQASHKLAASMYEQASPAGAQQGGAGAEGAWQHQQGSSGSDEDVVDADYQEVG